ncbi:hypothetical protein PV416_29365 [Streptomyces ipomoeae]|uniref:hypothetical protein n=1 Tax=Streptomyces ipomoeae TaxID=103232 RepID=UPI0029B03FE8|nr:hypothetical protein [Streptomyces ipomoeae]MDX2825089.1 hypothetical protein [Streptomyces ipomoeae]MDX2879017.1 hypothetical protein [Streptomyces ipomoeae]
MTSEPIRIIRGEGGEVEVEGPYDEFAAHILARAGFMTFPTLRGQWVRLPFDLGRAWENEHASWAAEMLMAARYLVHLDPDLRVSRPGQSTPSAPKHRPAMTAQAPPAGRRTRP